MSESSRAKAHRGLTKTLANMANCGNLSKDQFAAARQRLIQSQPGWSPARCRQRAMVEAYLAPQQQQLQQPSHTNPALVVAAVQALTARGAA